MKTQWYIRVISLMLATVVLAGCGSSTDGGGTNGTNGNDGSSGISGRYVEQTLMQLNGITGVFEAFRDSSGNLAFYAQHDEGGVTAVSRNVLTADNELERTDISWMNALLNGGGRVSGVSEASDGTVYLLYTDADGKSRLAVSEDGMASSEIEIEGWNDDSAMNGTVIRGGGPDNGGSQAAEGGNTAPDGANGGMSLSEMPEPPSDGAQAYAVPPADNEPQQRTTARSMDGAVFFGGGMLPQSVAALDDGFLIGYAMGGISRYTKSGEPVADYGDIGPDAAVYAQQLAAVNTREAGVTVYDLADSGSTGNVIAYSGIGGADEIATLTRSRGICLGMDEDGVFIADTNGISRYSDSGWEQIVDGSRTSLIMANTVIAAVVSDGDGGFWAVLGDRELELKHYVFSSDSSVLTDAELNIWSLYDNSTIRQAIGEYQLSHPNVQINLEIALDDDSSAQAEDVIRALNTQLIAGKGPDIIVLDGLPISSYIEKGVLTDISPLAERLVSSADLSANFAKAYERDGKVYGLPSRFAFPVMMGDVELLDSISTLSDLAAAVESGQGGEIPLLNPPDNLREETGIIMNYYDACAVSWTGDDGSIDQDGLSAFYRDMLTLDTVLKEHTTESDHRLMAVGSMGGGGFEVMDMGAYYLGNGDARFHIQDFIGIMAIMNVSSNIGDIDDMGMASLFDGNLYYPQGSVGIVSGSAQKELAEDFIEMLLSRTVQDEYLYDGLPVNTASLADMAEDALDNSEQELDDMGFADICARLDRAVFTDQVVKNAVEAQAADLLSGAVTPEQAAANVVESTRLYLAE